VGEVLGPGVDGFAALGAGGPVLDVDCRAGLAYVLNYDIVTRDGATAASLVTYLLPIVAVALGAAVLDESVEVATVVGAAVVLVGVALARSSAMRRQVPGRRHRSRAGETRR